MNSLFKSRKIIITCGTGGVGKTTLSAALALRAALSGKRTIVITVDPAKRLKTSLGIQTLGNQPTHLEPHLPKGVAEQMKRNGGSLDAVVPDTQKTFDELIKALSPNAQIATRILENPIVQILGKEYSGANEYMAVERLDMIYQKGNYDFIVLDTPPSRNTLALIEAPQLLSRFFEEKLIRWLALPAHRLASMGMRKALGLLERLTGEGFITHLLEFATSLFEIQVKFQENLERIDRLFKSDQVGFLAVMNPSPESIQELQHFISTLEDHRFYFDGLILNRTLSRFPVTKLDRARAEKLSAPHEAQRGLDLLEYLQQREAQVLRDLQPMLKDRHFCCVPELIRDVHSLEDLAYVAQTLED